MRKILAVALLALGACASGPQVRSFIGPDGRQSYAIGCSSFGQAMSDCYIAAREACAGDYDIIQQVDRALPVATGQTMTTVADSRLYVSCKKA